MTGRIEPHSPPSVLGALHHEVPPPSGEYRWVYLWHWPIRAMHWAAAISIAVLVITGFTVGRPYFLPQGEMQGQFFIGWMRLFHFVAAGVLVATAIVRLYWLVVGNKFERLPALFPVRRRDWVNMFRQVKFYLLIHPEKAPHYLGHNPLQQLAYTAVYLAAAVMVLTGFAMYGQANPGGLIRASTIWVPALFGSVQNVKLVHHVLTWFFIMFVPLHIYLAIRADVLERGGAISSIFTGGRFVPKDESFADE
jgi:Ni/Fe-hydrogenase b-type cytochrome subunit